MTGTLLSGLAIAVSGLGVLMTAQSIPGGGGGPTSRAPMRHDLPEPSRDGTLSVEKALNERRSQRSFSGDPLTVTQVGQILWATQGTTDDRGYRTAPSAGATFPLNVYLVAGAVDGLGQGVYRYVPSDHSLVLYAPGDRREALREAALGQGSVGQAPIVLVITGTCERTTQRYGERGVRYTHIEVGHAAQNTYLQARALGLGTVAVGAFEDEAVKKLLRLPDGEEPLYILPVGKD